MGSYFKQRVMRDVDKVFLNLDHFAEVHNLNGVDRVCIIDKNINGRYQDSAEYPIEGVFTNTMTIYVKAEMELPAVGSLLCVDGGDHLVISASAESGMLVITVEEHVR
jgi:hypothetical protein